MFNIHIYNSDGKATYSHYGDGGKCNFEPHGGVRATIYKDNPAPDEPRKVELFASHGYIVIVESDPMAKVAEKALGRESVR